MITSKRFFVFCFLLTCTCSWAYSQNKSNIWYFGYHAGLDFNSGAAVSLADGNLYAFEGCATVCDSGGNLLFYTNGDTVWNKNHKIMPNGLNLLAGPSGTQAALIVQQPDNCNKYYVFTTGDHLTNQEFTYSVVDMNLNGGLGDIIPTTKNTILLNSVRENLTAILNSNGHDFWIISHLLDGNEFYAYQLTATGLNPIPKISAVGASSFFGVIIGPLKASHDGRKLAMAFTFGYDFFLFDFNAATGVVSNQIDLGSQFGSVYGVEFSPNDSLLYLSSTFGSCDLFQYDLNANTGIQIASAGNSNYEYGGLQLAPDGRIYMARYNHPFLDIIKNPNDKGAQCNFVSPGINLANGTYSQLGMINLVPNYIYNTIYGNDFSFQDTCGTSTWFYSQVTSEYDSITWNFGDPSSGGNNISHQLNPKHNFSSSGTFSVQLIIYEPCSIDTIIKDAIIKNGAPISVNLGNDTSICEGNSLTLNAGNSGAHYQWSNGDTLQTIIVNQGGKYYVTVFNDCSTASDTIIIAEFPAPNLDLGNDTTICPGESVQLNAAAGYQNYVWSPASGLSCTTCPNPIATPGQTTLYVLSASTAVCNKSDSILIQLPDTSMLISFHDTTLCKGDSILLLATSGVAYQWTPSTGLSCSNCQNPFAFPDTSITYHVLINFSKCSFGDSLTVDVKPKPEMFIEDDTICSGKEIQLISPAGYAGYLWLPSSYLSCNSCYNPVADPPSSITYFISISNGFCTSTGTVNIFVDSIDIITSNDTSIKAGASVQLFASGGIHYHWFPSAGLNNDTVSNPIASPAITTTYTVEVTSEIGCTTEGKVTVTVSEPCTSDVKFPNAFSPNEDGINDYFHPLNGFTVENYLLRVFDRWGEMVFESTSFDSKWDGSYKGSPCQVGVYVYYMKALCDGNPIMVRGNLTLLR